MTTVKDTLFKALSIDESAALLSSHMPQGNLWANCFNADSNIGKLIYALAIEYYRICLLTEKISDEINIRQTLELLEDWEKSVGIPSVCFRNNDTTANRRSAVEQVFANFGGVQTLSDFERVATFFGFTVNIYLGVEAGGFPLYFPITFFDSKKSACFTLIVQASIGASDEFFALPFPMPFSAGGTNFLKCIFELIAPANVKIIFTQTDFSQL